MNIAICVSRYFTIIIMYLPVCIRAVQRPLEGQVKVKVGLFVTYTIIPSTISSEMQGFV